MEITILTEDENPMLHRTDVRFRVSHVEATPDRLAVRDSLAARLGKSANEVVVRKLDTKFGMRTTIGEAKVYEAPEFAHDVEQAYMLDRNKITDDGVAPPESGNGAAEEATDETVDEDAGEAETEEDDGAEEVEVEADDGAEEADAEETTDEADDGTEEDG